MKSLLLLLFSLLLAGTTNAQNCTNLEKFLSEGDRCWKNTQNPDFQKAIEKYTAAVVEGIRSCGSGITKAQQALETVYREIERLKENALQAQRDEAQARKAAEEDRQKAIDAGKAAFLAKTEAERQRDTARAERDRAERLYRQNLDGVAKLFASKAKDMSDSTLKRDFFCSAFRLSRDSLGNALANMPTLIEAANGILQHNRNLPLIAQHFDFTTINDFESLDDKTLYLTGGGNKIFKIALSQKDAVLPPNVTESHQLYGANNSNKNNCLAISPNQKWLAIAGAQGQLYLFESEQYQPVKSTFLHNKKIIYDLIFLDNYTLASVGADSMLLLYDIVNDSITERYKLPGMPFKMGSFDVDGYTYIAAATSAKLCMLSQQRMTYINEPIHQFAWDETRQFLYAATHDQKLKIFRWEYGRCQSRVEEELRIPAGVRDMQYKEGFLLLGYESGLIQVWNTSQISELAAAPIEIKQKQPIQKIDYMPANQQVVTAGKGYLQFHPLNTHEIYRHINGEQWGLSDKVYQNYLTPKAKE